MAAEEVYQLSTLPPYPKMIITAIEALHDDNGSNKSSISKYIESTYGGLPAGHSALLTHHLNKMKESGELVFLKNNYMKMSLNAPPRRGRGRPPKPKNPLQPVSLMSSPKPRGRPPKDPYAPPKPPKPVKLKASIGGGKPRGRPRKMAKPMGSLGGSIGQHISTIAPAGTGRPRGRPRKVKAQLSQVSVD